MMSFAKKAKKESFANEFAKLYTNRNVCYA